MSVAKDCQRYAVRCLQDARTTVDPRHKTFLVEMAQARQRLAEQRHMAEAITPPFLNWIAATDYCWSCCYSLRCSISFGRKALALGRRSLALRGSLRGRLSHSELKA